MNIFKIFKYIGKIDDINNAIEEVKDVIDKIIPIINEIKDPELRKEIIEAKNAIDKVFKKE